MPPSSCRSPSASKTARFSHDGLIEVNQKHVRIFDPEGLRAIVSAVDLDHSPSPVTASPMKIQKA